MSDSNRQAPIRIIFQLQLQLEVILLHTKQQIEYIHTVGTGVKVNMTHKHSNLPVPETLDQILRVKEAAGDLSEPVQSNMAAKVITTLTDDS